LGDITEQSGPPIAVVGPGAVGSTVAAFLHASGHRVLLCGHTRRDQIEVRPDGSAPIVVPGPVHTDPAEVTAAAVLLAVKATQIDDAVGWLSALCDGRTTVCVLQNGVEQVEMVQPHCGGAEVLPAIVWFPAETQPEGWVRLRGEPRLVLPAGAAGPATLGTGAAGPATLGTGAGPVSELLRGAGLTVELEADFTTAAWRKLLVNALAGFMVLTGRRSGMFRRGDVAGLARRYLAECLAVARAEGANLDDAVIAEIVDGFASYPTDIGTSMLADREAHRPLEWDIRNGVIPRKAGRHGLATPISEMVVPLLAAASEGPG
jgi:2-dehydropantoate 2-reductase